MVYNAPLHRTEQWLRELAKQHWITLHWVVIWVALSAIRMQYVATGKDSSFQTNLVATAIYYILWGVLAVKHACLLPASKQSYAKRSHACAAPCTCVSSAYYPPFTALDVALLC